MDHLPVIDINQSEGSIVINGIQEGLEPIIPLLEQELCIFINSIVSRHTKQQAQLVVYGVINNWINQGFIYYLDDKLRVDIVKLVAKKLGYDIVRFKPINDGSFNMMDRTTLSRCLTNQTGNLHPQLEMMPAELIEWFGKSIDDENLNNAIEKYKNKMILDVAGISKKGKLNVNTEI